MTKFNKILIQILGANYKTLVDIKTNRIKPITKDYVKGFTPSEIEILNRLISDRSDAIYKENRKAITDAVNALEKAKCIAAEQRGGFQVEIESTDCDGVTASNRMHFKFYDDFYEYMVDSMEGPYSYEIIF